jgi:hypothetical protein
VARKKLPEPCPNKYVKTGEEKKKVSLLSHHLILELSFEGR